MKVEDAYGFAFMAASLGAAVSIATLAAVRAADAMDERAARKRREKTLRGRVAAMRS